MEDMKQGIEVLEHCAKTLIAKKHVFDTVNSLDDLDKSIKTYGQSVSLAAQDPRDSYNRAVGAAYEVYAEFFLKYFGKQSNPRLGIDSASVRSTSVNSYEIGVDFWFKNFDDCIGAIQVKFRSDPTFKFTRGDLSTFADVCDEHEIPRGNQRIIFTNLIHRVSDDSHGIFSYDEKRYRIIDRSAQEQLTTNPQFWDSLRKSLEVNAYTPTIASPPALRDHQIEMVEAGIKILSGAISRGKFHCVTGGGKTLVEYTLINKMFHDFGPEKKTCIIVAPTIALVNQHYVNFREWGAFGNGDIFPVCFKTGDEPTSDDEELFAQTTKSAELKGQFDNHPDKHKLIFTTYKSIDNLCDALKNERITADFCCWDEFHHLVQQNSARREFLENLPIKKNAFFSASRKRGRVVTSEDELLFGQVLCDIHYKRLREQGILVPKLTIKLMQFNSESNDIKKMSRLFKDECERFKDNNEKGINPKDLIGEAAFTVAAAQDMTKDHDAFNIVTFSKQVAICKKLVDDEAFMAELPDETMLRSVSASTTGFERASAFNEIRKSSRSILLQHSILKEGVDITGLNAVVISRAMDTIGIQQAIGRVVRAHPRDTEALRAGNIKLDDPRGWYKYDAVIYICVYENDDASFMEHAVRVINKLFETGLESDDYNFIDYEEERAGVELNENDGLVKINTNPRVCADVLNSMVRNVKISQQEPISHLNNIPDDESHIHPDFRLSTAFSNRIKEITQYDAYKPTHVPFETLGKIMLDQLPQDLIKDSDKSFLVMYDVGLLVATVRKLGHKDQYGRVTFITYDKDQAAFVRELGAKVVVVEQLLDMRDNLTNMKFDVIVGNPPFQPPSNKVNKGSGSRNKIWHKFIELSFELIKDDGHLLFVTPHSWRMGNFKPRRKHRRVQELMFSHSLKWQMDVRDPEDYFPMIGHSNSVDAWYISMIGTNEHLPQILCHKMLLPKTRDSSTLKLVAKFFETCERSESIEYCKQDGVTSRHPSVISNSTIGDEFRKFKLANTSAHVRKREFTWTSVEQKHWSSKKVMVSDSGALEPWYEDGSCGTGTHTAAYIVETEKQGELLIDFLNSPLVSRIISNFSRPGALGCPIELIEKLPKEILTTSWQDVFHECLEILGEINCR